MTQVKPNPDINTGKAVQVEEMFDSISPKYDFLNRFLSLGIDRGWRKKCRRMLEASHPQNILDVATGTGDLAIELTKLNPKHIEGVDISEGMLSVGEKKIRKLKLNEIITLKKADAENLPFADNIFDAVSVSFGVRNFENLESGIRGMQRVLKPGGTLLVLEFSKPKKFPFKQIYFFYFKKLLPVFGKLFSGNSRAYTYLPESVNNFPDGNDFASILTKCGLEEIKIRPLTFGICTIYTGIKA